MEPTLEKSQEQAEIIQQIGILILCLDHDYIKEAAERTLDQASRQESMAVLHAGYSQNKTDLLRQQGVALRALCDYIESCKEVDKIKGDVHAESVQRDVIARLFN